MNILNKVLASVIIFGAGTLSGMYVSKYNYDQVMQQPVDLTEMIAVIESTRLVIQEEFMRFYINEYCDGNHRVIDFIMTGSVWAGIYCDKDTVMILSDSFPPLPITVLYVNPETDE